MDLELVAVGVSAGGLEALRAILRGLPVGLRAAVVVAQHRAPESHRTAFRDLLGAVTRLEVREAEDKDRLEPGTVYVAAPDYHLLIDGSALALTTDAPEHFARPSINVLFESAAESYRDRCIAVILTGANQDGAEGLARIVELGGTAIVQDPATAARDEMPIAAIAAVPGARVAQVADIPSLIVELCSRQVAA